MIKLNHNLSLDLYYNEEKTIDTKEYDKNSRYITVSLTYKGKEYQISGDTIKARIKWLKPDKKPVFNDCVINSDNTITIDLTEQMLIVSGVAKATLSLYDINTDQVLSTTSFNAIVEASAVSDDTILSSDEYNSLHNEFKRLNNKVEELDKTVTEHENIREKNEDSRKSNEIKRETNESERINSENARMNNENTRIDSENERVKNENTRIANENVRQHNEATRETQEDKRESDTAIAIEKANEAAKNANDKANDLQTKLDNHHFVLTNELENSVSSTSTTHAPTANAVKTAYDKAVSVENTINSNKNNWNDKYTKNEIDNKFSTLESNIDWKESVNSYADIAKTYPNPEDGWTVNVKDTDYTYRYSGSAWVAISANAIPKATQSLDGLLSKEDKSNYDDANNKKHTHSNKSVLDGITSALITAWNSAAKHITDTVKHITPSERTNWNAAYDKANDALPLSGGTLTGSLTVQGNATDNPIRARGIAGSDGENGDGDLYLQYGTDNNVYLGKSGKSCIDPEGYFYQIGNKVLDSKNYTSIMTKQGVCDILGYTPSTGSDSFEIGGTNLFHGTKEFEITNAKSFSNTVSSITSETYNGLKIRKNLTAWNFYRPILSLESGNYVFSGYVKGVNGLPATIHVNVGDTVLNSYVFSITSDFKRYSLMFEITEKSDVTFYLESRENGEIYECGWKLEKGNKTTDWSPAPEDLAPVSNSNNYVKVYNSSTINSSDTLTVNDLADQGFAVGMIASTEDSPIGSGWFHALNMGWGNSRKNWVSQIALGTQPNDGLYYRTTGASIVGKPWKRVLDTSNYANYTYPPEAHNHNTVDSNFTCFLTDNTDAGFAALHENGATTGFFLKTIRGQYTAPGWFEGDYASGIAFGGADTHAVISCKYNYPRVTFAGGNGTEPNWWMRIAGTSGHSYKLDDFITTSGTTALSGSIVPNEDVGMELGDETHRFTNIYSSNITTGAIYMEHDSNAIYESGNDAANGNGGGLNNLVVRSWWGVSFTSNCAGGRYGGGNQTAVGIDCREGIVKAYNFAGLINGHSVNADVPTNATYIASYGSSDNYMFSDYSGSDSGTNYYYIRYTNGIQMIFIEIHNDYGKYSHTQGSGKKTISFPVSFVNNKYFAFGKQNISSDGSGNNLVSFTEKNTSSICIRHYPYGYDESADYFSMFFVGRWK